MAEAVGEPGAGGRQGRLLAPYLRIKEQHRHAILPSRPASDEGGAPRPTVSGGLAARARLPARARPPPTRAPSRAGRPGATARVPEPTPVEGDLPRLPARAAGGGLAYVDAACRRRP